MLTDLEIGGVYGVLKFVKINMNLLTFYIL